MLPMAAVLATPEPETAPKKPQVAMAAAPRPPGILPRSMLARRMSLGVLP